MTQGYRCGGRGQLISFSQLFSIFILGARWDHVSNHLGHPTPLKIKQNPKDPAPRITPNAAECEENTTLIIYIINTAA